MSMAMIVWRGLYMAGHEACRLVSIDPSWQLTGSAAFSYEGQPCWLDYQVICDADWNTRSGQVTGWVGSRSVEIELRVDDARRWWTNGIQRPEVAGCIDLDLNFSPSTNLLPIRRLNLAIGQQAEVNAAWLRFPDLELVPLSQVYRRLGGTNYRYESGGGTFTAVLQVNPAGFVTNYPGLWQAEAEASLL